MAKSLAKKCSTPQAMDWLDSGLDDSAVDSSTRKKAKTLPSDSEFIRYIAITIIYFSCFPDPSDQTHQSSRANKGNGGQIAQLRNIKEVQTWTTKVVQMDIATSNEPLNPFAPSSDKRPPKRKACPSKGSTGKVSLIFHSSLQLRLTNRPGSFIREASVYSTHRSRWQYTTTDAPGTYSRLPVWLSSSLSCHRLCSFSW